MKRALGDLVGQIIYCTDSTIALSWCRNLKIKLRLFVYNRVMTILQMCERTTGETEIPLFHIDGKLNLADLLTKHHELSVDLRPNKWLKNSRLPVLDDIVLFVFLDSEYGKGGSEWRLGKVTAVKGSQISVSYSVRGAKAKASSHSLPKRQRCLHFVFCWGSFGEH